MSEEPPDAVDEQSLVAEFQLGPQFNDAFAESEGVAVAVVLGTVPGHHGHHCEQVIFEITETLRGPALTSADACIAPGSSPASYSTTPVQRETTYLVALNRQDGETNVKVHNCVMSAEARVTGMVEVEDVSQARALARELGALSDR
jgi:hypothetical protein